MSSDLISLIPNMRYTRRGFIATSVTAGFTLAAGPVIAQTMIRTDTAGLSASDIKIPSDEFEVPGYAAMPATGGPFPVILVVQEIFGVHEHIKDVCRRFAKEGYLAVAPDLYARKADMSKVTNVQEAMKIAGETPDEQVMADLDATVAWAKASGKGDTDKLGITGFCWGGRIAWLYAAHNPNLKAAVAWYGRVVGTPDPLHPKHPLELAAQLHAPVLGLYGGADQGIPVETVERMRDAARAAGKKVEIIVYPEAGHAFHADYRPSYREEAAKDGWKKALAWFREHGVG
ncbi:MAG TPA: dienelactone hydrolase family protein [Alphaproteobacteria bacterium]|jgi:carboxymethylenebutenolidase